MFNATFSNMSVITYNMMASVIHV